MTHIQRQNHDAMWTYILSLYPNAVEDYYFTSTGELIFYRTPAAELPYACVHSGNQYKILTEF